MSQYPKSKVRALAIKHGYRSGLEDKVAKELTDKGIPFDYEKLKIKWVDHKNRTYTPDFELPNGIIIETKGRFLAPDRMKHLAVREQYPEYDIRFVFSNPYAKLSKVSKTTYADWCDQKGFLWAAKTIPEEWIDESPDT